MSADTDQGPLAMGLSVDAVGDHLVKQLGSALERRILQELQTGGGLTLQQLVPARRPTSGEAQLVAKIHALVDRLKRLRSSMTDHVADTIVGRFRPSAMADIGAGLAPWSIAVARRQPSLTLTTIDLPEQEARLRNALAGALPPDRLTVIGADVLATDLADLPEHDVVLLANICHVLPEAKVRLLLHRAFGLLRPGGVLTIIDQVLDEKPDWAKWGALYAVGLPNLLPGGYLYAMREYRLWLQEAGGRKITVEPVCTPPELMMITAFL